LPIQLHPAESLPASAYTVYQGKKHPHITNGIVFTFRFVNNAFPIYKNTDITEYHALLF